MVEFWAVMPFSGGFPAKSGTGGGKLPFGTQTYEGGELLSPKFQSLHG